MNFVCSAARRACLNEWTRRIEVSDILTLLSSLRDTSPTPAPGKPAVLIVVARKTVPIPTSHILNSLQAALPALLDSCQNLIIAVEGDDAERDSLRACFKSTGDGQGRRPPAQVFDSLSTAFAHAQRFAPHDVLELQEHVLHRNFH